MEGIRLIAPLIILIAVISLIAFFSLNTFAVFKEPMDNTSTEYNATVVGEDLVNVVTPNITVLTWVGFAAVIFTILIGIYVWFTKLSGLF